MTAIEVNRKEYTPRTELSRKTEGDTQSIETYLKLGADGQLICVKDQKEHRVVIRRCFPWSHPMHFLSLRNADGDELMMVENADKLDIASKSALTSALQESGFLFEILAITAVDEEFELRNWKVQTTQGFRSFQTKLLDWPYKLQSGELLIQDVHSDLYLVKDPENFPEPGKSFLWAFID